MAIIFRMNTGLSSTSDEEFRSLRAHSGQKVIILRAENMHMRQLWHSFRVKFRDGYEATIYIDELFDEEGNPWLDS